MCSTMSIVLESRHMASSKHDSCEICLFRLSIHAVNENCKTISPPPLYPSMRTQSLPWRKKNKPNDAILDAMGFLVQHPPSTQPSHLYFLFSQRNMFVWYKQLYNLYRFRRSIQAATKHDNWPHQHPTWMSWKWHEIYRFRLHVHASHVSCAVQCLSF